jgi:pilus assembly protein CpaB
MIRIVILAAAVTLGGVTAWLAVQQAGTPSVASAPAPSEAIETSEVLVAAVPLERGHALDADKLRWQTWPRNSVAEGFITRAARAEAVADLAGTRMRSGVLPGEPIRPEKLALAEGGLLSALLRPGKRAVAVRVSAENTAGGFVLPNDHVDVIHTRSVSNAQGQGAGSRSTTLLRNVRVLAIDQIVEEQDGKVATVGKTATLELDPVEVEKISAAGAVGSLSLALRPVADSGPDALTVTAPEQPVPAEVVRNVLLVRSGRAAVIETQGKAAGPNGEVIR